MRLLLTTLVLLTSVAAVTAAPVTITIDGKALNTSPSPEIRGGRVYMPVKSMKKLGLWVG